MGLDMYAYTTDEAITNMVDFEVTEEARQFHCWRKHPNLHGWMEALYRARDGVDPEFNCTTVVLTADNLDDLEEAVKAGTLPYTEGFFFGASDGSEKADDLAFIAEARKEIADGQTVFYYAWW